MKKLIIAIDFGGTNIRVVLYKLDGTEIARIEKKVTEDFGQDYKNLVDAITSLSDSHGIPDGIALALAGKVNSTRDSLTGSGNLPHWVNQPIVEMLRKQFECQVILGNDAEAAGLAEALFGYGQGQEFLFVIEGTGVGGCLVKLSDTGEPIAYAGEFGHGQVPHWYRRRCGCGQINCLEAYAGGNGIRRWFHKPAERLTKRQWRRVARKMAIGLRNAVTFQPVPLIVVGGGIAYKQEWLLAIVERQLARKLRIVDAPRVILSKFETAGTLGALALYKRLAEQ